VAALTRWLQAQGVDAEKLNKNAIEDLLSGDLPEQARRAVELRKEAAKTSTAKLDSMQAVVCRDDRARGLHLYHGAGTGRWSGRLIQTQNMPRGTGTVKDPEDAVDDMLTGDARWIDLVYGRPMSAVSDMLRSCITASPGNRLLAADYSSIEGRVTSWLAGEQDEIDAYRANDAGTGAGIYEIAAGGIFNVDPFKVTKGQRQVGKAATLALGFGGGVLAFNSMAGIYGIDMAPVYPILRETASAEVLERAGARYEECFERSDTGTDLLTREAWIASEVTKVLWRNKHPHTVDLWRGLEDAARQAVQDPGLISTYGKISYRVARGFLWCRLPSGRCLAYGSPRIEDRKTPWGDTKPSVTALGVDSVTKRWTRFALYGGLLTENAVQAVARDLMAHGMLQAEDAGYPIVLTVHDEAVADVPEGFGSLAEFERLLCSLPEWASGLPVEASGWEGHRYRKD
jgi:DNA polymerase